MKEGHLRTIRKNENRQFLVGSLADEWKPKLVKGTDWYAQSHNSQNRQTHKQTKKQKLNQIFKQATKKNRKTGRYKNRQTDKQLKSKTENGMKLKNKAVPSFNMAK